MTVSSWKGGNLTASKSVGNAFNVSCQLKLYSCVKCAFYSAGTGRDLYIGLIRKYKFITAPGKGVRVSGRGRHRKLTVMLRLPDNNPGRSC